MNYKILTLFLLISTVIFSTNYMVLETFAQGNNIRNNLSNIITPNYDTTEQMQTSSAPGNDDHTNLNNNFENWKVITGNWNYTTGGLQGGSFNNLSSPIENTIINPTLLSNLSNITTSFKINVIDNELANYVYIVYSFIDVNNYQKAGIHIFEDDVFVRFAKVQNGSTINEPLHPYVNTGLKWEPGTVYNMRVSFNDNLQRLFINDTQYAANDDPNTNGSIGLNYGRIKNIDFLDFSSFQIESSEKQEGNININSKTIVRDSQSIILGERNIPSNSFIHVYDSKPYNIISGQLITKLPCDDDGQADLQILMGEVDNLELSNLTVIPAQSDLGNLCLYSFDIGNSNNNITDVLIRNNSTEDIEFPATSSFIISVELSK